MGHPAPAAAVLGTAAAVSTDGWRQVGELLLAFVLSAAIGFEREYRHKNAGIRTHTLVGVGAALFMLVSKYGFFDVLEPGRVNLDPSRVAAQIVSGVGFLGAGLIFVKRNAVRGLTTAAGVWVTAAVGAAAGAGLSVLAALTTAVYFVVMFVFPLAGRWLPTPSAPTTLRVRYPRGRDVLRRLLAVATEHGFVVDDVASETPVPPRSTPGDGWDARARSDGPDSNGGNLVQVDLRLRGRASVDELTSALAQLDELDIVEATETDEG